MTGDSRCTAGRGMGCTYIPERGYQPKNMRNLPGNLQGPFLTPLRRSPRRSGPFILFLQPLETPSRGWWGGALSPRGLMDKSILLCTSSGLQDKANSALCHGASSITCDRIHARGMLYGDEYHHIWKDDFTIARFQKKRTVSMSQL